MARPKRVLAIGDLHCGHRVGLTPPQWQDRSPERVKYHKIQSECWNAFDNMVQALKPIDILIVNGDAIDGRGERSGGTELITVDRNVQCNMAVYAIKHIGAKNVVLTYGTPYHTGQLEDIENTIADRVKGEIHSHEWIDIEGTVFDIKHKVGSSSIPHGKGTAIAKDRLWNLLWSEHGEQPKADVLLRSHVHYHFHVGEPGWLAMTLPALQGQGTKFGARQCSGIVHFGMVHFDCSKEGYTWAPHVLRLQSQKRTARRL